MLTRCAWCSGNVQTYLLIRAALRRWARTLAAGGSSAPVRLARRALLGLLCGAALYLVNFLVIWPIAFGVFQDANQPLELTTHLVFARAPGARARVRGVAGARRADRPADADDRRDRSARPGRPVPVSPLRR